MNDPATTPVEVTGFRIFGGVRNPAPAQPVTATVRVREFSLIGGVHVRRV